MSVGLKKLRKPDVNNLSNDAEPDLTVPYHHPRQAVLFYSAVSHLDGGDLRASGVTSVTRWWALVRILASDRRVITAGTDLYG